MKLKSIILCAITVFNISYASASNDTSLEALNKSAQFSKDLIKYSAEMKNLAQDLRDDNSLKNLKIAHEILVSIAAIEIKYWNWKLIGKAVDFDPSSRSAPLSGAIRFIMRVSTSASYIFATNSYLSRLDSNDVKFGKFLDEAKASKTIDADIFSGTQDIKLRSNRFETIQAYRQLSQNEKEEYINSIIQKIEILSQSYRVMNLKLEQAISEILDKADPLNMPYWNRVLTLGNDQIRYGHFVIAGLDARVQLVNSILPLNKELQKELQAALKLN